MIGGLEILEQCDYTCVKCSGKYSKDDATDLHAHHIFSRETHDRLIFDLENGVVLCKECHNEFHNTYGNGYNNREQFEEFLSGELNKLWF